MRARLMPVSSLSSVMIEPWVDRQRSPYVTDEGAFIPVKEGFPATHTLSNRRRSGRGYQKLGDVIIFHGEKPTSEEMEDVSMREHPRGILWISGHDGVMRKPRITLLTGNAGEVTHKESGIIYHLDVEKIMFSQGNREEKNRISQLIKPGERVGDMFAGIGYFTLGMARAGAQVHAMEINPVSCLYLCQNVQVNRLSSLVTAEEGDCRNLLHETYERIHMGHFEAVSFLPYALDHVHPGTILHVHMIQDQSLMIEDILSSHGYRGEISIHPVKKVGPHQMHMVADVVIA